MQPQEKVEARAARVSAVLNELVSRPEDGRLAVSMLTDLAQVNPTVASLLLYMFACTSVYSPHLQHRHFGWMLSFILSGRSSCSRNCAHPGRKVASLGRQDLGNGRSNSSGGRGAGGYHCTYCQAWR